MNLYILRHASAGVRRSSPAVDVKRPLDKEGKEQCLLVARYLNALKIQFDLIVSSPL
jgi:phosphohistidine phosphatase